MTVEVGLGFLNLLSIDEAHVADAAIGKRIDHGPANNQRQLSVTPILVSKVTP